ncbi:MAG: ThuA domain-containing protein, partial [Alphaproteobacteria bacterium]
MSLIAFPIRELFDVKLDEFDLIIFDRYSRRGVIPQAYLENVARYVRNGGAFLEAVGPSFGTPLSLARTPLGTILPTEPTGDVFEEGFKARVTDLGRRHPVTEGLPGEGAADGEPS